MASFALSDISKSVSQCKELPDNEMTALEFPGGIAYDHEALPKIVAVHTLIELSPDKTNAQDDSLINSEVKKKRFAEVPLAAKTMSRHGSRRWIIRSKPELPFSQITTAPKTPEEIFQTRPLPSPSFDAFPTKKLFNFCDINHGYSYDDVYENKTTVPPSQELPTSTALKNTSSTSKLVISRYLNENEKQTETAAMTPGQSNETEKEKATKLNEIVENEKETFKSLKWDHSNHLGDSAVALGRSLNLKQENSPAEILTTTSDAKGIPSVKFPGQSDKNAAVEENKKHKIIPSHATSLLPSEDSVTHCADRKEHCNETSKAPESMITFCSDPKPTSKESKKNLAKTNDTEIVGKRSQKQRVSVSKKNLASNLNSEQEASNSVTTAVPKNVTKLGKTTISTQTTRSLKPTANCSSRSIAAEQSSSMKNNKNITLSLRERVLDRIKRLKDKKKSYKETPEAKNLEKYRKYRKLGFGVASSLNEMSKNGDINPKLESAKDGQVKKELSKELLEEVDLMETLGKDCKTLKTEFTTEQKNLDSKQNGTIKSKNGMKENEEMKDEVNCTEVNATMECSPTVSEPAFVHADEDDSNVIHSIGSNPIQELENITKKVNGSDDLSAEKTVKEKQEGVNWTERIDDVIQTSTPEKGKSLNQCLDKLKTITSSVKRKLDSDNENGLHANNPDSGSISKRPRKAVPRRLAKGRWPSYSDDSISPDTSLTEHPGGFNLTSSDVDDLSSSSTLSSASDTKGQKTETTDEPLCDVRTLTGKSDLTPNEENLKMENIDDNSMIISAQRDTDKLDMSPSIALPEQPVSESVTTTFDNGLPPTRFFTKDTLKEQIKEATWEPYWFKRDDKTAVSNQCWVSVPYPTIPRENYTIKTSLDREERIKTLLAKQNQLLSKINSNVSGNSG